MSNQQRQSGKQQPDSGQNIQQGGQGRDPSPGQQSQQGSGSQQPQQGGSQLGRDDLQRKSGQQQGSRNR